MDEATEKYQLNFSLLATPTESYSGKSISKFKNKYGEIKNITGT